MKVNVRVQVIQNVIIRFYHLLTMKFNKLVRVIISRRPRRWPACPRGAPGISLLPFERVLKALHRFVVHKSEIRGPASVGTFFGQSRIAELGSTPSSLVPLIKSSAPRLATDVRLDARTVRGETGLPASPGVEADPKRSSLSAINASS
jgi:hypothetical protein